MKQPEEDNPHYIGHRKRLRERFLKTGREGLQDYELLETLLCFAIPRKDTKPAAKALLKKFRDIPGVLDAPVEGLIAIEGIGRESALLFKVVRSLLELYTYERDLKGARLSSPSAVNEYCRVAMGGLTDEQFRAFYLNNQNVIISEVLLHDGTVDQAVVYPRKLLEHALRLKATGVILVHNHPGGGLQPSRNDISLTERIMSAAREIGLTVHDHLIITGEGYFSFREQGLLK